MADALFANRFRIVSQIAIGGMGTIHRAIDVVTGCDVALKRMIAAADGVPLSRFLREAQLLSRLEHPNLVRYVAHDPHHDPPWLAMEWLPGADLAAHIARGPIPVPTALGLAAEVAGALATLHSADLVHRDLKPANVFVLEQEGTLHARLLDLGIARDVSEDATVFTGTGALIGTPLYMSPEQARGSELDARSDIWSLGVVLFEMIAGHPPYARGSPIAVLAKILVADVPRLSSARTGVSAALDDLVAQMLTHDPADRPPSAAEVELRLRNIGSAGAPSHAGPRSMREARLQFVLMVIPSTADHGGRAIDALREDGARVERALDGTIIALYGAERSSADDAIRSARSALALRRLDPLARIALALSRGESSGGASDALERAASLLQSAAPGEVTTDASTIGVIGERAQWTARDGRTLLVSVTSPTARTESTVIVGREAELGALEGICRAAWEERTAAGALVVGEPGVGKSTLLEALLRRVAGHLPPPSILTCAADTRTAAVPYAVAGSALRALANLPSGSTEHAERTAFTAWVSATLGPEASTHLPFLLRLIGLHPTSGASLEGPPVAPERMRADLAQAWIAVLKTLAAVRPLLLVAEDLHWADHASADLLLRALDVDAPFALVASVRSEARDVRRTFLEHPSVREVALRGLSARACEQILRRLLPDESAPLAPVIVGRAGGNPLFLRELARLSHAGAYGASGDLPESLELVVQQRFDALAAPVREVARVAAAFGDTAYVEGVRYVLDRDVRADVDALVASGLLENGRAPAIPAMSEVSFRHSFLRETAERMTVRDDARAYHERIYGWIQHLGLAMRPQVLARHAELAGRQAEAFALYTSAAASAARVFQLEDAVALLVPALRVAVDGRLPVSDVLAVADSLGTQLQSVRLAEGALDAMEAALRYVDVAGTTSDRAAARIAAGSALGVAFAFDRSSALFDEAAALLQDDAARLRGLYLVRARQAILRGRFDAAEGYMSRYDELSSDEPPTLSALTLHAMIAAALDDFTRASEFVSRATLLVGNDVDALTVMKADATAHYFTGRDREGYALALRAVELARRAGLTIELIVQLHNAGDYGCLIGEPSAAELLRESLRLAVVHGYDRMARHNRAYLSYLATCERGDDAQLGIIARAQEGMLADGSFLEALTNGVRLARAYRARGRTADAVRSAQATLALAEQYSFVRIRRELRALLDELERDARKTRE